MSTDFNKRTWAEINLDNLQHNVNICKSFLDSNTELMAVVKANAYGHGDRIVAPYIESLGVRWFAVSNINEAIKLRHAKVKGEVFILGYTPPEDVKNLLKYDIIQCVTGNDHAIALLREVPDGQTLRVHCKIDTGMGRIGIRFDSIHDYVEELKKISELDGISLEGIFTHLSDADSDGADSVDFTKSQIDVFLSVKNEARKRGINLPYAHYLNSAGGIYLSDKESSLARFGIALYGLHPNFHYPLPKKLKPVMSLKTSIVHIKEIEQNVPVSYGRTFHSSNRMRIATLSIGYADGYPRLLSNKGRVIVNGQFANIVGRICMDQIMIDISDIEGAKVGDVVTMFGSDGDVELLADEVANMYGTIGYELVCGVGMRVQRVYLKNNEIFDVVKY